MLRLVVQQMTLLGLTPNPEEFSAEWLGIPLAYHRIRSMDDQGLSEVVTCLELSLEIQEWSYHYEFGQAETEQDRWLATVRLTTIRSLIKLLRNWRRSTGIPQSHLADN